MLAKGLSDGAIGLAQHGRQGQLAPDVPGQSVGVAHERPTVGIVA